MLLKRLIFLFGLIIIFWAKTNGVEKADYRDTNYVSLIFLSGDTAEAKIISIDNKTIVFVLRGEPQTLFKINRKKVYKIIYPNGQQKVLNKIFPKAIIFSFIGLFGFIYALLPLENLAIGIFLSFLGLFSFIVGLQTFFYLKRTKQKGTFWSLLAISLGLVNVFIFLVDFYTFLYVLFFF